MTGSAIDAKSQLLPWLIAIRANPVEHRGAGGIKRLFDDLDQWRRDQENPDDMIPHGNAGQIHPRRHGLHFLIHAPEHFKGYYGSAETRHLYVNSNNWGDWLEQISDSPEQALERFFAWLDIFVESNGMEARPVPLPVKIDERPFVRVRDVLRPMLKDPSKRPGDGSLVALHLHLRAISADGTVQNDEFTHILLTNISVMLAHMGRNRVIPVEAMFSGPMSGNDIDALAQKANPTGDRWNTYFSAVSKLHSNWRGLGTSQGGVRDLIKG